MIEWLQIAALVFLGCFAAMLGFVLLLLAWPLLVCWHFGHPIIGIFAELVWLMVLESG